MSNLPMARTETRPRSPFGGSSVLPEWPLAVRAAFAAAVHYVLPSDEDILEISADSRAYPPTTKNSKNVADESIAELLRQRGAAVYGANFSRPPARRSSASIRSRNIALAAAKGLPFRPAAFGGVYLVNLTSFAEYWPPLVQEIVRVIQPDGVLAIGTSDEVATDITNHMQVGWEMILGRNGIQLQPGATPRAALNGILNEHRDNARSIENLDSVVVCRWSEHFTPRQRMDAAKSRRARATPPISDGALLRCLKDYERWLKAQYGDLNTPLEFVCECTIHLWRFVS